MYTRLACTNCAVGPEGPLHHYKYMIDLYIFNSMVRFSGPVKTVIMTTSPAVDFVPVTCSNNSVTIDTVFSSRHHDVHGPQESKPRPRLSQPILRMRIYINYSKIPRIHRVSIPGRPRVGRVF